MFFIKKIIFLGLYDDDYVGRRQHGRAQTMRIGSSGHYVQFLLFLGRFFYELNYILGSYMTTWDGDREDNNINVEA